MGAPQEMVPGLVPVLTQRLHFFKKKCLEAKLFPKYHQMENNRAKTETEFGSILKSGGRGGQRGDHPEPLPSRGQWRSEPAT
jgi:hypothetical protein